MPRAVFHRGGHIPEEAFRAPAVQSGRQIGIMQGEFPLGSQDEVAQVIGGVLAVHGLAADGHGFPVGIALGEGVPLGHDVHLHELGHARPQAFQQFHGSVGRDGAPVEVGLVQGPEILVHAPVGDGRARALLKTGEELDEPLALDRFVEGTGGIGRNAPACFRDEGQLLLALGIRCFGGHLFGQVGMAGGPEHDGVTDDGDGFVERTQLVGVPGVVGIQSGQFVFRFLADVHETAPDGTVVVMHPLQGRAERGGLVDDIAGGDARLVSEQDVMDLLGKGLVELFVVGLPRPVGGDLLDGDLQIPGRDPRLGGLAGGKVPQGGGVKVPFDLGIHDAVARRPADAAGQELVVVDVDLDMLRHMVQGLGPAPDQGLAFRQLHGLGEVEGPLTVEHGHGIGEGIEDGRDARMLLVEARTTFGIEHGLFMRRKDLLAATAVMTT